MSLLVRFSREPAATVPGLVQSHAARSCSCEGGSLGTHSLRRGQRIGCLESQPHPVWRLLAGRTSLCSAEVGLLPLRPSKHWVRPPAAWSILSSSKSINIHLIHTPSQVDPAECPTKSWHCTSRVDIKLTTTGLSKSLSRVPRMCFIFWVIWSP